MIQESDIRLRWEDEEECAAGGMSPGEAVLDSIRRSTEAYTVVWEGEVLAYWGVREDCIIGGRASVWMLSTPAMDRYPRWTARSSRYLVEQLLSDHYYLSAFVDCEYTRAVRWLEWLGFERGSKLGRFMEMHITRGGAA